MRQYKFDYGDIFKSGLVSNESKKGFTRLQNLYPWDGVLKYMDRPVCEVCLDAESRIFRIGIYSFKCSTTGVARLIGDSYIDQVALVSSTSWSCLNFIKFGILTDGVNQVYVDENGACSLAGTYLPKATSSCDLNGQVILGGLDGSWNSLDRTYIGWSKIGSLDFDVDKTNEAGFFNPDIGNVLSVLKLNKDFVSLGASGVHISSPSAQTFGHRKLSSVGILDLSYATSNGQEVYYVDKLGDLNQINSSNGVTNLGYRWLFKGKSCKLHWAETENELRIVVDNQKTFILNSFGMYETNLVILGSSIDGLFSVYGSSEVGDAYLETFEDNADVAGLKSISEVYIEDSSLASKTIHVVSTIGNKTNRSREQLVNGIGTVVPNIVVDRFKIAYRISDYTDGKISGMHIQTIRNDGRFGKGVRAALMNNGG